MLARYDAVIWFDCEAIEGVYGDHLEICRGFDNRVVFKSDDGEWCIRCNDLPKEYPYLMEEEVRYYRESSKLKTERGINNRLKKMNDENKRRAEMPDVKRLEIEIEWSRSRMWGMNPTACVRWETADGKWHYNDNMAYASGCGYDKESTVVAACCNKILCGMLWRKQNDEAKAPYGVVFGSWLPRFEGGVGMSCYRAIAEFLGGELEHVASGKSYDKYVFTFKDTKKI